ncbi:hypothetical protein I7I51_07903, partial [Histoplasma capsulatum]
CLESSLLEFLLFSVSFQRQLLSF